MPKLSLARAITSITGANTAGIVISAVTVTKPVSVCTE